MPHTTNYFSTFIEVADDCPVLIATEPPLNPQKKSSARLAFEWLMQNPHVYTSDDLLFALYAQKQEVEENALPALRESFFSKGQPCMRASDLPKKFGWGVHFDDEARIALVPRGSEEYEAFQRDPNLAHKKAMRSSRT